MRRLPLVVLTVLATCLVTLLAPAGAPAPASAAEACTAGDRCSFYLANSWRPGSADIAFAVGGSPATALVGDWDGNGSDTVGLRRASVLTLLSASRTCAPTTGLAYGRPTDTVLVGDWDGNGTDTPAVRRGNVYHLSNSLTGGAADAIVGYGRAGDEVFVGDWDGNGTDTLALRRGNVFYLKNSLGSGAADVVFGYGRAADEILVGDWDGNGTDTLAVRRGSQWHMRNDLRSGPAQQVVAYGRPTDTALAGDWDGNGTDTPGVYRGARAETTCQTGAATNPGATPSAAPPPAGGQGGSASFTAGTIISDAEFFNAGAMSMEQVRAFLVEKNPRCTPAADGTACLKDYRMTTPTLTSSFCAPYQGAAGEDAATIISKAATACGVNPRVLLVILQKEQGLVTASGSSLTAARYSKAMGFRCPDGSPCDPTYAGLASQVYYAASRLVQYGAQPTSFRFRAGGTYEIAYHPTASCGSSSVTITNRATAALYNYTPYQPNAAALANMQGSGDSCSSYGNRNFWRYYRLWFGSTGV
ncbi:hypothetical protein [Actinomyces howellii]|uniref:Uncharacterized protein n=1 Tax=Actinomyces howellii TaxID=52771 RepID=A0A3S4R4Y7_9ACTO|nr:hypothetical protein [Actinomyces howellii]VEG29887.1 Uncharacterised protein [Actinomyces howellii]